MEYGRSGGVETRTGVGYRLEGGPTGLSSWGKYRGLWKGTAPKCELTTCVLIYPFKHLFLNHPTKF